MEGTIYLKRDKKNQPDTSDSVAQSGGVTDGKNQINIPEESEDAVSREVVEPVEDTWVPGFMKSEEDLQNEAKAISQDSDSNSKVDNVDEEENLDDLYLVVDNSKKDTDMSEPFIKYLEKFKEASVEENKKASNPVFVDEIASGIAKLYESVRRIIDWKEEHLMRRAVIERILKRTFVSKVYGFKIAPEVKPEELAEPFVMELIRSGYFPNGKIDRSKIFEIQKLLEKYLHILNNIPLEEIDDGSGTKKERKARAKKRLGFHTWIIETAACEAEEVLDPALREYALMDFMTNCLMDRICIVPGNEISDEDKFIQVYIAVHRTLYNLDRPLIEYRLLKLKYPDFIGYSKDFSQEMLKIYEEIGNYFEHPKRAEFYGVADKYDAPYLLVGDAMNRLEHDISDINPKVEDKNIFLSAVRQSYEERLKTLKKRLSKIAIFSTLSILVAGLASLLIFEIPIAKMVRGYFSVWAIVADLAIPTALMFILVWMIKPPSNNNLDAVIEEVSKIVYKVKELDVYEIRLHKKVRRILRAIFFIVYILGGLVSLYGIYWIFKIANVPWTSLYINTINVAMIVASAMAIRQKSKELTIVEKPNILEFLLDFFSIPLAKIGTWFSDKWREYNFVSVFFTALIDFPFSSFVASIESWRNFIKEKKTGIS